MKKVSGILLFLLITIRLFSQTVQISGTVQDTSAQKQGLKNAVVMAVKVFDSTLVSFTRTNENGLFKLTALPIDTYQVVISHPSYSDKYFLVVASQKNLQFDFGAISMPPKNIELNEVVVYAYKDPVYYKGDTLIYTADSFKVQPNATVEDLIKKLPGMKVNAEGKISFQGKQIDQVFVDGDEFFGSDPTVATKNLNANSVESVQVFDKQKEAASGNEEETVKVMNLKLKEEAKKGYFGKVSAASDVINYHEAEVLANKFNNKQKISLFGLYSNTPRSQFDWDDVFTYGLDDERNFTDFADGTMMFTSNASPKGVPVTGKAGLYYSDKYGKNTKINSNYTFAANELNTQSESLSQYFLSDTNYFVSNLENTYQRTESHKVKVIFNHKLDSLTEIEVIPDFKYTINAKNKTDISDFYTTENIASRKTSISNVNEAYSNEFSGSLRLNKDFKKKGRKFYLYSKYSLTDQDFETILKSDEKFYDSVSLPAVSINQKKINTLNKANTYIYARHTEPITKRIKLQMSYNYVAGNERQNKNANDFFNGDYTLPNDSFSNQFENNRITNILGLTFNYEVNKVTFYIGADARDINVKNTNLINNEKINQDIQNILPYLTYRYKFSKSSELDFRYSTSSSQPGIYQLQPVPDNSNPNSITLGNPDLLPTFRHKFSLRYFVHKPISGKHLWSYMQYAVTNNAFANKTVFDTLGRTITQTVNVMGNRDGNIDISGNYPLFSGVIQLQPDGSATYRKTINFINGIENETEEYGVKAGLDISVETKNITGFMGGDFSYNDPRSTVSSESNKPYSNQKYRGGITFKLPKKIIIKSDASYNLNSQRNEGYNVNYIIWSMSVGKTFFKTENFIVSIDATDILNQNISATRTVSDNVIVDNKTDVIGRYILARAIYKFNSNNKKADETQ